MIDLHCHSNFSDGILTPQALLIKALEVNIKILALTDHDTIEGVKVLREAASGYPIKVINGIEVTTRWKKYDIHILGLNFDMDNEHIQTLVKRQSDSRILRAQQIAEKMKLCGVDDAYEKACALAGHKRIARPHFAQIFVNEGLAKDLQGAFKRYLSRGKPAFVPTPWVSIPEAVEGIIQANGCAVIAHPLKYSLTRLKLQELIRHFKEAGGLGMEVVSGEMTTTQMQEMAGLCLRYELLASTGSDYHGDGISRICLGRQPLLPLNCTPIWHQWIN
ncbi:metal dependent phosphoesterase [Legionella nautarum]|uniref:Metal dependent phosphoesterase n=1 Tax=Legionella nautarum TaxID=45070 RepID=A0A0W0WV97_9GAMM|nr:PHP domain-containing protein [Legionella nautarum]KTD36223.1 metal dependent phosphoesterase [Legionella nautarum]